MLLPGTREGNTLLLAWRKHQLRGDCPECCRERPSQVIGLGLPKGRCVAAHLPVFCMPLLNGSRGGTCFSNHCPVAARRAGHLTTEGDGPDDSLDTVCCSPQLFWGPLRRAKCRLRLRGLTNYFRVRALSGIGALPAACVARAWSHRPLSQRMPVLQCRAAKRHHNDHC
jgi:hypothetical protein